MVLPYLPLCDHNFLDLSGSKTKELIINFRISNDKSKPRPIHGEDVEIVDTYKYLGVVLDSVLKYDVNRELIVKHWTTENSFVF